MIKNILIKSAFAVGKFISLLLLFKPIFRLYNFIYERSPYPLIHFLGKYVALPNKNDYWEIILMNGRKIKTNVLADNIKTMQFAISYKWHSPELNFTEYLLNNYYDHTIPWIDVGANLGIRSLLSLSEGRPAFFIEPNKELNSINRKRCELNNFTNYSFFEVGASNCTGHTTFFIDNSSYNSTINGSLLFSHEILKEEIIVTDTIDNLLLNLPESTKTACVKIDVEGHELEVLAGAKEFITKYEPTLIIEVNTNSNNFSDFRQIISLYDYDLYEIGYYKSDKYFRKIDKTSPSVEQRIKSNDFLVTKDLELIKIINKYVDSSL